MSDDQWVSFTLAGEKYAHPVASIKEVLLFQEPSPVPGAPYDVDGILNIRGEVLTVISARRMMQLPGPDDPSTARIISLETSDGLCGIIVDQVEAIISFGQQSVEPPPGHESSDVIQGTIHYNDTLYIVANFLPRCEGIIQQM